MKTHTTLLLPSQYTPDAWHTLCLSLTIACMKYANFRPHPWGFSAFSILGKPGNITALIFHSVFHPDTPPEEEQKELASFAALRDKLTSAVAKL